MQDEEKKKEEKVIKEPYAETGFGTNMIIDSGMDIEYQPSKDSSDTDNKGN